MADFIADLVRSTVALFVVIDPVGSIPVFIALTQKMDKAERASVTKTAIITVAGLLFIVAIELLTHGEWRFGVAGAQGESGVVPLAFPLLAGSGAITAVIISFQTSGLAVTAISILIVIGITYVVLRYVDRIYRVLGRRGSMIVTRVFAVLIAVIAVQFVVDGAWGLFV